MTTLIPELEARPLGVAHVWPRERTLLCLAVGLLAVLVPLIAIDGRSFWIDEFGTWLITQHTGIREWTFAFVNHPYSDGQMPLYHFYMFWWVKAFGGSELAMRLANLPSFAILCIAIGLAPVSARLRLIWLAVIALHAFLWYYLNEARPYLLLLAGSALACVATMRLFGDAPSQSAKRPLAFDLALFVVGSTLMVGGSILGALWVGSTLLAIGYVARGNIGDLWRAGLTIWPVILVCGAISAAILGVALHSFAVGARATQNASFSVGAMVYGFFELLGTAGFGPGRNELRAQSGNLLQVDVSVMIAAAAVGAFVVLSAFTRLDRRLVVPVLVAAGLPVLLLAMFGYALHWRAVGRHLSPLLLAITFAYASEISRLLQATAAKRIAALLLIVGLGLSALSMRFSETQAKDDYADAAAFLRPLLDQSKVAWWVADPTGAAYYGLIQPQQLERKSSVPGDRLVFGAFSDASALIAVARPDVIAYSKPDLYDKSGSVLRYIEASGMRRAAEFPAFAIYVR